MDLKRFAAVPHSETAQSLFEQDLALEIIDSATEKLKVLAEHSRRPKERILRRNP